MFFNAHTHFLNEEELSIFQASFGEQVTENKLFSIGIHPEKAKDWNADLLLTLENIASQKKCVAIGEIGLDNRFEQMGIQEEVYIEQLKIAARFNKPVILHCVNSWERCKFLHSKFAPKIPLIFHGLAKASIVKNVLNYPFAIVSIGTAVFTNVSLQEKVIAIPLERLFLETDTSTVEISEVYQFVSTLKNVTLQTLQVALLENAKKIFGI